MAATAAADGVGWSSKQVQRLMTVGRDWQAVRAFYRAVVNGHASLELLGVPVGAPATPQDTAGPAEAAGPPPLPAQPGTQPEGGAEATRPELREAAIKEEEEAEEASSAVDCAPSASTAAPCGAAEGAQADGDAAPSSHKKKRQKRCSSGNSERNTYRLAVAYEGEAFDGWMHQDGLNTVEGALLQVRSKARRRGGRRGSHAAISFPFPRP